MNTLSNFLDTALSIDQQEGTSEQNYKYQKETLKEMYNEQKEQLKDSAIQALPFGVAEASRAIHGLWETKNRIFAFKEKYSPQLEAFKAKATDMFENIGKEGGKPIDYGELINTAKTKLGKQALDLVAPEVLKRTGIDLNKAVNVSKGEGGLEAGLANLKEQGLDVATGKITRIAEAGVSRVREAVAPAVDTARAVVSQAQEKVTSGLETAKQATQTEIKGVGAERATNPRIRAMGETTINKETLNPLFEGASDEVLAPHVAKITEATTGATTEAVKSIAGKAKSVIESYKAGKAQLQSKFDEAQSNLSEAQAKVERLQTKQPAPSEIPSRTMYPAERGRTPTTTRTTPELEQAKAEVATHQATIEDLRGQASQLKQTASSAFEETQSAVRSIAGKAYEAGKGVLGVAGEGLGVYGAVQAGQDLARGNVSAQQGFNDATGLYFGARSTQGLGTKAISAVQSKVSSALDKSRQIIQTEKNKTLAYEGKAEQPVASSAEGEGKAVSVEQKPTIGEGGKISVNPEEAIKTGESLATRAETTVGEGLAKQGLESVGKTIGVGLAEQGAELGVAEAGASVIPVVGEAVDIGLGLYTAINAIVDLFKSPPKPPPPPPPQQQVVSVQHQQGVF